jgi:hypothetical protein
MVWWQKEDMAIAEPIASGELQDTEALADAVALMLTTQWVDKRKA